MGQLVLAAKVTHVPSLMLSEAEGSPLKPAREGAVRALRELGRRARERQAVIGCRQISQIIERDGRHARRGARCGRTAG